MQIMKKMLQKKTKNSFLYAINDFNLHYYY